MQQAFGVGKNAKLTSWLLHSNRGSLQTSSTLVRGFPRSRAGRATARVLPRDAGSIMTPASLSLMLAVLFMVPRDGHRWYPTSLPRSSQPPSSLPRCTGGLLLLLVFASTLQFSRAAELGLEYSSMVSFSQTPL